MVGKNPVITNGQKFQDVMEDTFGKAYPEGVDGIFSEEYHKAIGFTSFWWNREYKKPE